MSNVAPAPALPRAAVAVASRHLHPPILTAPTSLHGLEALLHRPHPQSCLSAAATVAFFLGITSARRLRRLLRLLFCKFLMLSEDIISPIMTSIRSTKRVRLSVASPRARKPATPEAATDSQQSPQTTGRRLLRSHKASSPTQTKIASLSTTAIEPTGSGNLDRLPKEIRQKIYGYCLEVDKPVCVKQCCGPNSTRRERASCRKHGDNCSKIGKGNGLTLYDEDQDDWEKAYGRFNILTLSRTIYEEACWVLHAKGSALIQSTEALQAYLSEAQCTFYRLPNHATAHAKCMWLSVARFRNVCLDLPWHKLSMDDPVECVNRLYEAAAFLMKAWNIQDSDLKPTSSYDVTVQLASLYTSILPFNSGTSTKLAHEWTAYWQPDLASGYLSDFGQIGKNTENAVERLVDLVGRHGEASQWKVLVEPIDSHKDIGDEDDPNTEEVDEKGAAAEMGSLERCCALNGVTLEIMR